MKKVKYSFVILHYQALEMTIKCVETLFLTFDMTDKYIVIIDNGSSNGSGEALLEKYGKNENVEVVISKENCGFARGNNLGFKLLKEKFMPEFIVIMNNDVLILQKEFFEIIEHVYLEKKFFVLGPDIYSTKTNVHQNPTHKNLFSEPELQSMKKYFSRIAKNYSFYRNYYLIRGKLGSIKRKYSRQNKVDNICADHSKSYDNWALHGACYVFSRKFIEKRDFAFNPNTFMFFEEEILHYECIKEKMLMTYSPDLKVEHFEDISTDTVFPEYKQKEIWKSANIAKSIQVLIDEMLSDALNSNNVYELSKNKANNVEMGGGRNIKVIKSSSIAIDWKEAA